MNESGAPGEESLVLQRLQAIEHRLDQLYELIEARPGIETAESARSGSRAVSTEAAADEIVSLLKSHGRPMVQSDLADALDLDILTVLRAIDRLVAAGRIVADSNAEGVQAQ